MWQVLECLHQKVNVFVSVFNNNLEWAKKLSGNKISLLNTSEMLQWNLNSSWLKSTVLWWNLMVSKWHSSEQ